MDNLLKQTKIVKENLTIAILDKPDFLKDNKEIILIEVTGEVDLYSVNLVKQYIDKRIEEGFKKICIFSENIKYIDSSGLGVLLKLQMQLQKEGGYIRIVSPSHQVTQLLELTKLNKILLKFHTLEEAVKRPVF